MKNEVLARFSIFLGKLLPDWLSRWLEQKLAHAGIVRESFEWAGEQMLMAFFAGIIAFCASLLIQDYLGMELAMLSQNPRLLIIPFICSIGAFLASMFLGYTVLYYAIDERTQKLEKLLPEFLILVSANLRAGLTPINAFLAASRPEFGALSFETKKSVAKLAGGEDISMIFHGVSEKFESSLFKDVVSFLDGSIKAGGRLADTIESSAEYVRKVHDMRQEVVIATRSYVFFLAFIIIVIMPFLLAVSNQFITMVTKISLTSMPQATLPGSEGQVPFSGGNSISSDFLVLYCMSMLAASGILVSMLYGIIVRGKLFYGIRYMPVIIILAIVMFFLSLNIINSLITQFV